MSNSTEKIHAKAAIQASLAFSIIVTLCGALHASEQAAEESKAAPKRTQADVERIIAEQKSQLAEDKQAFEEAKTYPYYSRYQVPAARGPRKGTELRKVLVGSQPNEKPGEYNLRVVQFANRKGVDYMDVDPRMPLREWTFSENAYKENGVPAKYRTDNHKIKAHLAGFRSIGYTIDEGEFKGEYGLPKLLLRFSDGRLRAIDPKYVSKEDQDFVAKQHSLAMDELKANRHKEQARVVPEGIKKRYPNPKQPGEKNGHMITESEFFFFVSGTEHPAPGDAGHWCTWINSMGDRKAGRRERLKKASWFDSMWRVYEYGGFHMPQIDKAQPREKFGWFVGGPAIDGKGTRGGGGGWHIGNGETGIGAHEWGHMTQFLNGVRHGGGETWADTLRDTAMGGGGGPQIATPFNNVFAGMNRYRYTHFYTAVGEDPTLGYLWYARLPIYGGNQNIHSRQSAILLAFEMFKRLKLTDYADAKMVNKPVEEFGDLFGEYAARTATFDFQRERDLYNRYSTPNRQVLEQIDPKNNVWRIPADFAPHPYGFNVIRLDAEEGAKTVEVDFTGIHDPTVYSDWRVCILAVGADGVRRYSDLWNKGSMKFDIKADDKSLWLVVAATPTAFTSQPTVQGAKRLPTYPWTVKLAHATVGTPTILPEEFGPGMTLRSSDPSELVRHKNGGGLVAKTATVAETAYVGPNAMVLGEAKVLDNASIEGFAVVRDNAVVKDNAKLYGSAVAAGNTVVGGFSRYYLPVINTTPDFDIMGNNPLPPRYGRLNFNKDAVWAAYAMMQADNVYLDDYYRYHEFATAANHPTYPNMNGFVFGKPQAVVHDDGADEPAAGLQFDGVKHYATLHPAAVDLPEATIAAKLIVEPNVAGMIFDLGTDEDNCMTFSVDKTGTLTLRAVVKGKDVAKLTGSKTLTRSKPVRLRVEADGKTVAVWMDKDKIAEQESPFRCSDLFGPDVIRKNTIAADRNGNNKLKALFDSVLIYAKVHGDFDALPTPALEAPPIVGDNILALLEKRADPKKGDAIRESAKTIYDFYKLGGSPAKYTWDYNMCKGGFFEHNKIGKRLHQLIRRDPDYVKWVDEILPKLRAEANTPEGQTPQAKERRQIMERKFRDEIYQKAINSSDESSAIGRLASSLWRTHWAQDYAGYLSKAYVPAYIRSKLGVGGETVESLKQNNALANDPDSWVKSSDVTASRPAIKVATGTKEEPKPEPRYIDPWSVEGILSGEYDKLTPELKQWYLHTHGPIKE